MHAAVTPTIFQSLGLEKVGEISRGDQIPKSRGDQIYSMYIPEYTACVCVCASPLPKNQNLPVHPRKPHTL